MLNNIENFGMTSTSNNYTLEAISILNKMTKAVEIKLKKANILLDDENKTNLIPLIVESLQSNKKGLELFRQSGKNNEFLTNIWVSKVKKVAYKQFLLCENIKKFKKISKKDLRKIAKSSYSENFYTEIKEVLLSEYGILLFFIQNIEGMNTDAVTFKLEAGTPVIGMSLRFPQFDRFWFTLMHELSHVSLHYDLLDEPIIDNNYDNSDSSMISEEIVEIESQADTLARTSLIPDSTWKKCNARRKNNDKLLESFSELYQIHPSIIAGFIKYEHGKHYLYKKFNKNIDRELLLKN